MLPRPASAETRPQWSDIRLVRHPAGADGPCARFYWADGSSARNGAA